jgi:hypothetical protein
MRKALLKHTADAFEKLAVGSMLVGMFQGNSIGLVVGTLFLAASYVLRILEVKL